MNYLKSYKVFESNESGLMDCLVELFDYGFEPELSGLDITNRWLVYGNDDLIKAIKLVKGFKGLKFSNYLEGDFDKDSFGPGDKNPRTREYTIQSMHIENEILELVDDASNKIINAYIPEATRGEYMINEYSVEYGTCVTIILKFFK
jgi:hypothetical protein